MKYVKFTGKYAELNKLGYKFQKLYANNYQQWNKKDYRIWRKGSEVTHDGLGQMFPSIVEKLFTLDISNLPFTESEYIIDYFFMFIYVHRKTNTCMFDKTDWFIGMKREVESYQGEDETLYYDNPWKKVILSESSLKPLIELYNKGWIEITE